MADPRVHQLAELAVVFGANLQPGQILAVAGEPAHAELARAIADVAYRRGARYVDVAYFDPFVKRARIAYAAEETLDFVPSWFGCRLLALAEERAALVAITGTAAPGLLDDLDPARAGRDQLPFLRETGPVISERKLNWTVVPFPTLGWARQVHPELDDADALARLWEEVIHVCRLDESDPIGAWRRRIDATGRAASALSESRFDALRLHGPGTDLTVGLLPTSTWGNVRFSTADGIEHAPNIPSEEVFTTPDPQLADGVVRSTKPLALGGSVVRGLSVRFEGGRAVEISADAGAEALVARTRMDDGASRLGEVALVDRDGRVGRLGTTFYDTLLDENAASHLAFGNGFEFAVGDEDRGRVNQSASHVDFMVGGDEVDVTGITRAGERVPVLSGGAWQI